VKAWTSSRDGVGKLLERYLFDEPVRVEAGESALCKAEWMLEFDTENVPWRGTWFES
jgi:hypothetical protein